jgi:hypothetical protein
MTGEVSKQRGLAGEAGTKYVVEAANNQNAKARLEIEYQNQLKQAQLRFANDQELRKIENDYAVKRDKINKDSQFALEKYRQSAPTDEQRNFEAYLARWKKNPENKGKYETDAFAQYSMDRVGGPGRGDKPYITGLNQLLESYQKDLEDITLPESEKVRIRGLIAKTRKDLEAAVSKGLPSALSGGNVDTNNPLLK